MVASSLPPRAWWRVRFVAGRGRSAGSQLDQRLVVLLLHERWGRAHLVDGDVEAAADVGELRGRESANPALRPDGARGPALAVLLHFVISADRPSMVNLEKR